MAGDFNFDATRMVFDNVVAESGGGRLTIGGTVAYGEGPLNYVLNARSDQVRIRYPVGMSWLVGGNLAPLRKQRKQRRFPDASLWIAC